MNIAGNITTRRISGGITTRRITGDVHQTFIGGGEPYTGEYNVTPDFETQTLQTKNKTLRDDVTVYAIPVSRTTNPQGGKTVYIGEVNINA